MSLKWINESKKNPGFSVYYAQPERDKDVLYVVRRKRKTAEHKPVGWRLFVRTDPKQPLRTIHMSETLTEAQQFADDLEGAIL